MIYFEGIHLKLLIDELKSIILNKKITKIVQYDKLNISLFFNKNNLFFSALPNLSICYINANKDNAPKEQLNFALILKKNLLGATLIDILQYNFERIMIFKFEKIDELGKKNIYNLIFEMMGKHSNIFLCDNKLKIINSLKPLFLEENKRNLFNGSDFEFFTSNNKLSPFDISEEQYNKIKEQYNLHKYISGIGKLTSINSNSYNEFIKNLNKRKSPILYKENNEIKIASFVRYQSLESFEKQSFNSISDMLNNYISTTISSVKINKLKQNYLKVITNKIKKNNNIIKNIIKEKEKYSDYEKYKNIGDILAANLYSIKPYQKNIELFDFYNNQNITIHLDENLTPQENLNIYYKKYNKLKKKLEYNIIREEEIKKELEYLFTLKNFIVLADNLNTLISIEDELIEQNILKRKIKKNNRKKRKNTINIEYIIVDNFKIYFGKNNKENEYITFKLADKNDIWLHIKDIPGSHVIIKGENPSENIILEAAKIAAKYSKINSGNITIDYTQKKYVKKIPNSKPGFVTYSNFKSIFLKI
ncbi:putative ribosome quality control (RQC) complex YloA/Tae2 family protein [Hypnocyclicus thermotrophus]|uniref:Ribosome quality control (RQC) complex YloA/Tae2 family protein n=1 Tax=Hypnocyclicus thermotrophus TaxID=1627895 RepID=A0AA46I534_9FUSO|nr:NFACT family protein [Hypnocyclicus thermotrophus]TDT68528.1 putative ribosome quality control (RQC) complex YloA/Tae2 family protein [Hypnocyclicus thermotrophus]